MTASIRRIATRAIRVPLSRPWGPDVRDLSLVEVVVEDSAGDRGYGFSWTPSIGAAAVQAHLDHDIAAFALGRDADAASLWEPLWRHLHEGGGGGITTIAMAGLDLALWDLAARRAGLGITDHLGRRHETAEVYGSGVNLHYPIDELVAQAGRWVDAGFDAVKVKVGSPDLGDDVERIRAVRDVIGPGRRLMIDANQRWTLDQAERAIGELAAFDLTWIEEPLRADDLAAHVALRDRIEVPVALGENLYTRFRFAEFIDAGAVDVVQPNIVRVGGITPFLAIAGLADERGVELAPHLLLELSAQLALALPGDHLVESVEDASFESLGALASPVARRRRRESGAHDGADWTGHPLRRTPSGCRGIRRPHGGMMTTTTATTDHDRPARRSTRSPAPHAPPSRRRSPRPRRNGRPGSPPWPTRSTGPPTSSSPWPTRSPTSARRASPASSRARPRSCACSRRPWSRGRTSRRRSTTPTRRPRRRAPTCDGCCDRSAPSRSSAPRTSRSRSRSPAATPRRPSRPDAR